MAKFSVGEWCNWDGYDGRRVKIVGVEDPYGFAGRALYKVREEGGKVHERIPEKDLR